VKDLNNKSWNNNKIPEGPDCLKFEKQNKYTTVSFYMKISKYLRIKIPLLVNETKDIY